MTLIIEFFVVHGLHLFCNDIHPIVHYIVSIVYIIFKILLAIRNHIKWLMKFLDEIQRLQQRLRFRCEYGVVAFHVQHIVFVF